MQTIEEILQAARRLSEPERRRLLEALQASAREAPIEEQRRDTTATTRLTALCDWGALLGPGDWTMS